MAPSRAVPKTSARRCRAVLLGLALACSLGCRAATPLEPANHSPVVHSLVAFPSTVGIGDSAVVVCSATDADGDTVVYDWSSDCRMLKKGDTRGSLTIFSRGPVLVVYPGTCNHAPLDTGWVRCYVRDLRGGGRNAGLVRIVVRQ